MISLKIRWSVFFLSKTLFISTAAVSFLMLSLENSFAQKNEMSRNDTTVAFLSYSIGSAAFERLNKAFFELVAQRTSYSVTFQSLPIKRYHGTLPNQKNSCSFNMTRTEENEKKYWWLRPSSVFLVNRYVTSDITEDQRNKPSLVLAGSDIHRNMKKAGYEVEGIPSRDQIAKMIRGKRAYSWMDVPIFVDSYFPKDTGFTLVIDSIVFKGGTWLVCSHDTALNIRKELIQEWDIALNNGELAPFYSPALYRELLLVNQNISPK